MAVAELVEGCPLVLKVIGQLLHAYGVQLIQRLKEELISRSVLDRTSIQEEQFRIILDAAFNRIGIFKDCGNILSLYIPRVF